MHRTVDHDGGDLVFHMRVDNSLNEGAVFNRAKTFVVDHDIKVLNPLAMLIDIGFDVTFVAILENRPVDGANSF